MMLTKPNAPKDSLSVILLTFQRPDGLKTALQSLERQDFTGLDHEVIVVDNDPNASAKGFVTKFTSTSELNVKYYNDPNPGVANARNTALKAAKGRYLAFLDDDQEALENWLQNYVKTSQKYGAALVFGPTIAQVNSNSKYQSSYKAYFSRFGEGLETGLIDDFFGCGNSLMDTHLCELPSPPFDPDTNETGGEDDLLYTALIAQGIKIAWSKNAKANEYIPQDRSSPSYIKKRSFAFGQSPTEQCAQSTPRDYFGVAKWMAVGTAQYCLYRPLSILAKLAGHPSYISYLAKAYEGAGKVLWFGRFSPKLYGETALKDD